MTSAPIFRPFSVGFALPTSESAGEGSRSIWRLVGRDFRPFTFHADRGLDRLRQCFLNQREMAKHPAPDDRRLNLRELEGERVLDVPLFGRGHGTIELARLAVMIGEALGPNAQLLSGFVLALLRGEGAKAALEDFRAGRTDRGCWARKRRGPDSRPSDACRRVANSASGNADG